MPGIMVGLTPEQLKVFERIAKALEELVELQKAESILRVIPPPPPPTQPDPFKPSVPDHLEWMRYAPTAGVQSGNIGATVDRVKVK